MHRYALLFPLCFCCLFLFVSVRAKGEADKVPTLQDAETISSIHKYLDYHITVAKNQHVHTKEHLPIISNLWLAASERASEIANDDRGKRYAFEMKAIAFYDLIRGQAEEAEHKLKTLLDEAAARSAFEISEKLPWIIISETLTEEAGLPKQGDFYSITAVPRMVLVNKEGKIIMMESRGAALQSKLAEIFEH